MGDEQEALTEAAEAAANGIATLVQKGEDVTQTEGEEKDGVKEMEEVRKDNVKVGTHKMDVDPEDKEKKETEEEEKKEEKESKEEEEEKNQEMRSKEMVEEMEVQLNEESKEKAEEKTDELEEKERATESKQEKVSKRRGKEKTAGVNIKSNKMEVEEVQKTPVASALDRPVRERKSVERLVESIEKEYVREFHIEKGRGTALKDIPNVAYKLSKRKTDDTCKLLHTILFGRRAKAVQVKSNISRFSGFVWNRDEEKQKIKLKEKLDKCFKEKLLEFCDVLDMPTVKANTRKEDIVVKLIDFLVAPQATTTELLAEKEQSSKDKKRKRLGKQSASTSGSALSKHSAKSRKTTENASKDGEKNPTHETADESDEDDEEDTEEEQEEENGVLEPSKNAVHELSESEEIEDEFKDESEDDIAEEKPNSKKLSSKKESSVKANTKKTVTPKKSSPSTKKKTVKSSSNHSKVDDSSDTSPKTFSRKKKTEAIKEKSSSPKTFSRKKRTEAAKEESTSPKTFSRKKRTEAAKEESSTPKNSASMDKAGRKVVKGKDKHKEDKLRPSDDELRNAICEILKEVDFNTATFTDILKLLAKRYNTDLTARKSSIKLMIQDELTNLAEEADDEEDEAEAEEDETSPASQGVKA